MVNIQTINVGLAANDKKGDPLRDAMQKVNLNFSALNTAIQGVLDGKGQANGYASLGADGRLLAAQAPIVYAPTLPTTAHDLNTYVTPGTFYQAAVAGATAPAGVNYPVAQVGFLEVIATGNPVQHVYTTREASPRRFWRSKYGSSAWSSWKEVVDTTSTLSYAGRLATAQDLNTYTTRGIWFASAASIATGGSNYPVGTAGFLLVLSESALGGAAQTSGVSQRYESVNGKVYTRYLSGGVWSPWVTLIDSSFVGVASGAATLNAAGQLVQNPAPARALGASENLNDITAPGSYYMNNNASATAALNYPVLLAGLLEVEAAVSGNVQVVQRYTTYPVTNPRTFVRLRFTSSLTWGAWFELARFDQAMTHTYILAVATDANTLVADNMWWSWASSVVVSGGSNFPPAPIASSGILTTQVISPTYMVQTCMMTPGSNRRPIEYRRIGNGTTTWSGWRLISPVQLASDLPTADCGDAIVDGLGLYRWNGSAYEPASLSPTMPTTAHDLNTYQTPGTYFQSSAVGAAAGTNYPIAIGGWLTVTQPSTGGGTAQEYVARNTSNLTLTTGPRRFWRVRDGGVWSAWQEVLSTALGMTHIFLTAATDANTLTADNTSYTWTASAVAGGANFPGYAAAGYMQVFWQAATVVSQELTLLVTGGKPLKFARFGNTSTGVWQPWKVTGAFNSAAWLPTSNMGDIYVDGVGRYSFVGGVYSQNSLPPRHRYGGVMSLGAAVPTRTLSIQAFQLRSDDDSVDLISTGTINKVFQASGNWSAGNNGNAIVSGGTGALTLFDVYAIRNETTGAIDVCATTSGGVLTPPTGWGRPRLLGTIYFSTSTGSIWNFMQAGNQFLLHNGVLIVENGGLNANTPVTVGVIAPHGRRTRARLMAHGGAGTPGTNFTVYPADLAQNYGGIYNQVPDSSVTGGRSAQVDVLTSTTRLIAVATVQSFVGGLYLASQGWTEIEGW